jgi:hypothetical protein
MHVHTRKQRFGYSAEWACLYNDSHSPQPQEMGTQRIRQGWIGTGTMTHRTAMMADPEKPCMQRKTGLVAAGNSATVESERPSR